MNDRVKNVTSGIVMGMINMAINIILPFVTRTIIIYTLGTDYVGLGGLFTSILSVLSLSELGVGAAVTYSLYKPVAENDVDKVNSILKLYRTVYRIIGLVIIAISICMLPFLDILVAGELPSGMNLQILFAIYVANTAVSYLLFGYKKVLFTANQRYDIEVNIVSIAWLIQYLAQVVVLLVSRNYYAYVLVFPIATILNDLISNYVIKKMYPQYHCAGKVEKEELIGLAKNVSGAFLSKLGSTVYLAVDNIVISAFLGLTILGIYGNYYYIIASLIAIFAIVHNSLRPVLGNCVATENSATNWNYLKVIDFVYMAVTIVCCSCCMVLFQDFERIWAGEENMLPLSIVVLLVIFFYSGRMSSVLLVYQEAAGIWWHGKFIPLIAAMLNLTLNIIGVQFIGLPAILLSSIITSVAVTLPGVMWVMFKYYFKERRCFVEYVKNLILNMIQAVFVIALSYFILNRFTVNSWGMLIVKGVLTAGLSAILVLVVNLFHPMMKEVIGVLKSILLKKDKV